MTYQVICKETEISISNHGTKKEAEEKAGFMSDYHREEFVAREVE